MSVSASYEYIGEELTLFAHARNWKDYLYRQITRYLGNDVLEVGAGLGETTRALHRQPHTSWRMLEPDPRQAEAIENKLKTGQLPTGCSLTLGTLADLGPTDVFHTILYIDVLEHIEDDVGEFRAAAARLRPGGYLVILCPAWQFLYSPFDQQIGHFRRYSKPRYRQLTAEGVTLVKCRYLDSMGFLASLANKTFLRQAAPTLKQVLFWDRWLVPTSRVIDPCVGHQFGKSLLGVWHKSSGGDG